MIAEARPDETLVLAAAAVGVLALAALIVAHVRGAGVLRVRPDGFAPVDYALAFGLFVFFFFVYALCLLLALGELGTVGRWAALLASIGLVLGADRLILPRWFRPRGRAGARLGEGLWVFAASLPLVYGLLYLMTAVFGDLPLQEQVVVLMERGPGWVWVAVAAVVIAPLVEELLFRGLLYPAMRQWVGVPIAIVLTGALFGLIHPIQVAAPLAVFGVVLAWIAESTGSLWPCVAAHAAFNGLTAAQVFIS